MHELGLGEISLSHKHNVIIYNKKNLLGVTCLHTIEIPEAQLPQDTQRIQRLNDVDEILPEIVTKYV